ncbi:cytochrome P450 [Nocardia callitridis]|uniref:cytochrome P450 n=1 Tax=Nocardia callitridis TaxID=648753 RepID=UPI0031F1AD4D
MHIAIFMDYHPTTLGGVQTAVAALCRGIERAGHRVTLFVAPLAGRAPADDSPNVVTLEPISSVVNGFPVVLPSKRNAALIDAAFAERGPVDVVHTQTTYGVAIAGMRAARRHGLPLVHTAQSRDDTFIENNSPAPYFAALAMRSLHGRFVSHDGQMPHRPQEVESRAARHAWRTMVAQAQVADHVITPTRHFADLMLAHGLTKPLHVVSNGVDDDLLDALARTASTAPTVFAQPDARLRLVWSGRMSADKRVLEAIDAVRRVENCVLEVYGEGELHDVAQRLVDEYRCGDRIRLHGRVSQAEVLAAMATADALLLSSASSDTQSMVLLEAVAVGLPVVYCDPALGETVPTGGGVRTADASPEAIAATLADLAADPAARSAMRAALDAHRDSVRQSRQVEAAVAVYRKAVDEAAHAPELPLPRSLSEVPTAPGRLPLVGHGVRSLLDAPGFVTPLSQLGPIVRVYFGQQTGYLLTTPDLVREVGLGAAQLNRDDLREAIEDVAGGSVNVLRGAEHKQRRRMIAPALRQTRLVEYTRSAADIAERWSAGLPAGQRVNLMDEVHGLVLDTVSSTLFTASFSDTARREIRDNVPWLLSQVIVRTALPPQVRRLRVLANYRWRKKAGHLRAAIGDVVSEYRRRDEDFNDVVSALIRHTDPETGETLSDEHIIDEAILMLAGGVGSMASLTGWLWHEVMRRPDITERLYAELDVVIGSGPVSAEHIGKLPYLKQVVSETLRFWGPWISAGTADGDTEVGGIVIPDGAAIMFSPYMIQHDKRYYPNPEVFDPDRWSPERADEIDKKANLSFGVGRRRCMGDHFALLEITLASAAFLARWHPTADPKYVVRASNRDFVLSPSAIPVTLRAR